MIISGADAFKLYDTYGFPLDLTELMARERGMTVDVAEFDRLMEEQKARGKAAHKKSVITVDLGDGDEILTDDTLKFAQSLELDTMITAAAFNSEAGHLWFVTEKTPFYAEMGGQVCDEGSANILGHWLRVVTAERRGKAVAHIIDASVPGINPGYTPVRLRVDSARRARIEAHHSGTHLLNWALRKTLGTTVSQKGSYVGPDRLRFDFSHGAAMTAEELAHVERLVNEQVEANVPVSWTERPYAEVKGDPSILQAFGDKYGETVRVVSIGDFSRELCGGTHVRQSGRVGHFKILHESAIAAGVRRIEAISGVALSAYIHEHATKQDEQLGALRVRKPDLANLPPITPEAAPALLLAEWDAREAALKHAAASIAQYEKDELKRRDALFQKEAVSDAEELVDLARSDEGISCITHIVDNQPAAFLPFLADALKARWQGVAVLVALEGDKVSVLASVSPGLTKQLQAGKIMQAIAPLIGGKGGGRPELAQGGGTNPGGVAAAFEKVRQMVRG